MTSNHLLLLLALILVVAVVVAVTNEAGLMEVQFKMLVKCDRTEIVDLVVIVAVVELSFVWP